MNRSAIFKTARFAISAGLIAYLVVKLDMDQIITHLRSIAPFPMVIAAAMIFGMILTNSLRWKLILRAKGIDLSLARSLYYSLISIFFSSFLPTSVGGDFARVLAVANSTRRPADAFASVIVDRLLGFVVLLPIGLLSIPFVAGQLTEWRLILTVGIVTLVIYLVAYLLLLRPVVRRISRLLDPLLGLLARFRARERLEKAYEAIVSYKDCRTVMRDGLVLSVVSKVFWIGGCYLVAKAFAMDLHFASLLLIVPVVELVRMIPISISGIGVREVAFVAMLRQFGIEDSMGFAFSVAVYVLFFGFAVLGGFLYGTRQFTSRT
jgi:uncharacterized protein (TIRG00374 family)